MGALALSPDPTNTVTQSDPVLQTATAPTVKETKGAAIGAPSLPKPRPKMPRYIIGAAGKYAVPTF